MRSIGGVRCDVRRMLMPPWRITAHRPMSNQSPEEAASWLCLSSNSKRPSVSVINSTST